MLLVERFHEHVKLPEESGQGGNPDEREHEDDDAGGQQRGLETQAVEVVDVVGLLVTHQPGGRGEGADVGEGIDDQVIEHRGGGLGPPGRDAGGRHADEHVAGVRD